MNSYRNRNGIDVWKIQAVAEHPAALKILSTDELERSRRFRDPLHGIQWRLFHCAMRDILSRYTSCAPEKLRFASISHQKPVLAEFPGVFFNLSHSLDRALLAVTRVGPVGVDIEAHRALKDGHALIKRNFSQREQHALSQLAEEDLLTAFYRVWTRKEAVIKAHGFGLGIPLDKFDVPCGALPTWEPTEVRGTAVSRPNFQLQEIATLIGFTGAVAFQAPEEKAVSRISLELVEYMG